MTSESFSLNPSVQKNLNKYESEIDDYIWLKI